MLHIQEPNQEQLSHEVQLSINRSTVSIPTPNLLQRRTRINRESTALGWCETPGKKLARLGRYLRGWSRGREANQAGVGSPQPHFSVVNCQQQRPITRPRVIKDTTVAEAAEIGAAIFSFEHDVLVGADE